MKTDDQKDEYAQRVNHEKEDRVALLRRLKDLSGYLDTHAENTYWPESWHRDAQLIKDTIAHLTAPSGCAEAGEPVGALSEEDEDAFNEWNRHITEYQPSLWDAYLFGVNRGREARPSPSPAGGADLVKALKPFAALAELSSIKRCDNEAETFMSAADYLGTRYPVITVGDIRRAAAAYDAATQATPAKDSK